MSFLSKIMSRMQTKAVDISPQLWVAVNGGFGLPTKSGQQISTSAALQNMAFYRGMVSIAEGVAQLPVELHRTRSNGRGVDPAVDHPLYDLLLNSPSQLQDSFQFWRTTVMHAVGSGNAVAFKNMVRGELRELIPVRPESVMIDLDTLLYRRVFDVTFENGEYARLGQQDVFHVAGPSWSPYKGGMDPAVVGREALGLAQATEATHASLHKNGVRPSGVLETDQPIRDKDILKRLRENWQSTYSGAENGGKTVILTNGMKFKPIDQKGVDAEHLDTRKMQIEEIARLLGIFPIMLGHAGDQSPTFASADAFLEAHVRWTLQPWIRSIKMAIETQLLSREDRRAGYHIRIDTSELLRGSLEARTAYYKAALGTNSSPGWLGPNEVREDDGWNPVEEDSFDRPLTPADYQPAKPQDEAPAKPAEPADDSPET